MVLDSRNWIDWNLLFRGVFEPHVTRLLERLTCEGGVAVDIGANIGAHTLTLAKTLGVNGTVLAFEPNTLVRSALERNVALNNFRNCHVYACALGDQPGVVPLRVPKMGSAEYSNMGLASLIALDTPHDLVEVQVRTLDDVVCEAGLVRIDLVKIDVQGYECRVLAGCSKVLAKYSPVVIFEFEAWAWAKADATIAYAAELFTAAGYSLWRIANHPESSIKPLDITHSIPEHIEVLAVKRDDPRLEVLLSGLFRQLR